MLDTRYTTTVCHSDSYTLRLNEVLLLLQVVVPHLEAGTCNLSSIAEDETLCCNGNSHSHSRAEVMSYYVATDYDIGRKNSAKRDR